MHALLIEDDLDLGAALLKALHSEGYTAEWVRRIADASMDIDALGIGCVLLDVSLPDGTGFDLLASWRRRGMRTPILVITARSSLSDRLAGLDGGADDFIVKPFAAEEMLSRIRAVMRRYAHQASDRWEWGDLRVEPRRHRVYLADVPVELSPKEFTLLLELAREPGVVISKNRLAHNLAPLGELMDFATIEVHVSNLRRKIGAQRVKTLRGVGYVFQP